MKKITLVLMLIITFLTFGSVYNIIDYGAVANDNIDDSTAIQTTINIVSVNGGGNVYVPPGCYNSLNTIYMKYNVSLVGDGCNASIITFSTTGNYIEFNGVHGDSYRRMGNEISRIGIYGDGNQIIGSSAIMIDNAIRIKIYATEVVKSSSAIIMKNKAGNIHIDECRLASSWDGIVFNNCAGVWIRGCHMNGSTTKSRGMIFSGAVDTIYISDVLMECYFTGVRMGGGSEIIWDIFFDGLTVDRYRGLGIHIETAGSAMVRNIWFTKCFFNPDSTNYEAYGILINKQSDTSLIWNVSINDCLWSGVRKNWVWIVGKVKDIRIMNNSVYLFSPNYNAIDITDSDGLIISNNIIRGKFLKECMIYNPDMKNYIINNNIFARE